MTVSTEAPGTIDWTLIQADYEAGIKAVRAIAEEHGITHPAIYKRAKRDGWVRSLAPKIHAKAEDLVTKDAVTGKVTGGAKPSERQVIEANATVIYQVRMSQRGDLVRARRRLESLEDQVDVATFTKAEIEHLLSLQPETITARQRDEARHLLQRLCGTTSRIASNATLVATLERVHRLERQAYGIAEGGDEGADNPGHPAGAPPSGHGRGLSDAERAIRLARLFALQPGMAALLPGAPVAPAAPAGATAAPAPEAPAAPVPPGRE